MDEPTTLEELEIWLDAGISSAFETRTALLRDLELLRRELDDVGAHPNHHCFKLGGVFTAIGLSERHLAAMHFWIWLPWPEALAELNTNLTQAPAAHLLRRLYDRLEANSSLHDRAEAYEKETGHRISKTWLREGGKLGFGLPLRDAGLTADDAEALAGVWTIRFDSLQQRIADVAVAADEPLVMVLPAVLSADFAYLRSRGRRSNFLRQRERYRERCASFQQFDAADAVKRWRLKPPTSRQGHLVVTTANLLSLPIPKSRTRGEAADWLAEHGANLRFKNEGDDA